MTRQKYAPSSGRHKSDIAKTVLRRHPITNESAVAAFGESGEFFG